jgi:ATP-dependent DNA helicase RecG
LRRSWPRAGLSNLQDLWLHLPRGYEDRTALTAIRDLRPGVAAQVEGRVTAVERGFRFRPMLRVALADDSRGTLVLRFFHFRAQQVAQFAPGARIRAYGMPRAGQLGLEIVHPSYRVLDAGEHGLGEALDPVYPEVEGIGPANLRKLIGLALQRLPDEDALELLPRDWLRELRLPTLREALLTLHAPPREADVTALQTGLHPAQRRLALEELLAHQLSLRRQRLALQAEGTRALAGDERHVARLREALPFALTQAQARVYAQLREDLAQPRPMLRLVQGDVGSGKTVVAAMAALLAVRDGRQAALMAPTELLAEQHLANLRSWLEPLGIRVAGWPARSPARRGEGAGRGRVGRGAGRRRHARADAGGCRVPRSRPGHRRRAAPLRRASTPGLARQGQGPCAAPAGDDRHPDPAHAGDERLCRPRRPPPSTNCRRGAPRSPPSRCRRPPRRR